MEGLIFAIATFALIAAAIILPQIQQYRERNNNNSE